jgi:hypothetical protein
MNPWPFVIAAYTITIGATLITTIIVLRATRRAEEKADKRSGRD